MITIRFSPDASSGGSGWFTFDPEKKFGWSFEETLARIHGLAHDQDMFGGGDKSVFDASGFMEGVPGALDETFRFSLCDWREDREIHVFFPEGERPAWMPQEEFVLLLKATLSKSIPREFETNYGCSTDDKLSWPPTPSKSDAVAMAVDALNGFLALSVADDQGFIARELIDQGKKARKALLEAF